MRARVYLPLAGIVDAAAAPALASIEGGARGLDHPSVVVTLEAGEVMSEPRRQWKAADDDGAPAALERVELIAFGDRALRRTLGGRERAVDRARSVRARLPAEAAMSAKKNRDVAILMRSGRLEALKGTLVHRSVASAGQHGYSLAMAALVVDAAARIRAYFLPMGLCAMVSLTKLGDGFVWSGKCRSPARLPTTRGCVGRCPWTSPRPSGRTDGPRLCLLISPGVRGKPWPS
jgi:hypothetical protein